MKHAGHSDGHCAPHAYHPTHASLHDPTAASATPARVYYVSPDETLDPDALPPEVRLAALSAVALPASGPIQIRPMRDDLLVYGAAVGPPESGDPAVGPALALDGVMQAPSPARVGVDGEEETNDEVLHALLEQFESTTAQLEAALFRLGALNPDSEKSS